MAARRNKLPRYITSVLRIVASVILAALLVSLAQAQPYSLVNTPVRQVTLETSYGFATSSLPEFERPIATTLHIEAMVGVKRYLFSPHSDMLVDYAHPHFFLSYYIVLPTSPESGVGSGVATLNLFRGGFGIRDGIGYRLEQIAVTPSISSAMLLAQPRFSRLPADPDSAAAANRFSSNWLFGTATAAGIDLQVGTFFALNCYYDWTLVFPRFVPLQFLGSHLLQWGLQIGAGYFIDAVFGKFPALLPVAHFLIKNAINYVLYALRTRAMHFPFHSEPPLSVQTFKLGISFFIGPKILD
ncbi:MAG: hypothetical protein RMI34_00185 [Chloroherpetonaceae bacterium]|nr:hypothetical protein [Chloroherpetonaceae bacterium]MCS7211138.1 hypothetical protein [Chloroherpetonaceae bacterium]MDW8018478.1 hypothetical protein [Chloroherpetonaceae bacterium]